jgi:hypothetical protein
LERRRKNDYIFIQDKSELVNEKVYYLYFRDKSLDRSLSPSFNNEESKKVLCFYFHLRIGILTVSYRVPVGMEAAQRLARVLL